MTSWRRLAAIVLAVTVGSHAGHSFAQAPKPTLPKACVRVDDGDVWLVKTEGTWKQGSRYGYYRAVVVRKGIEHAIDSVQVQFLEVDDKAKAIRLRGCVSLESPGLKGYVTDLSFTKIDDVRIALSIDVEMKAMNGLVLREVFLVDLKGEVRRLVDAKHVEID
jgi:hypothetical protein